MQETANRSLKACSHQELYYKELFISIHTNKVRLILIAMFLSLIFLKAISMTSLLCVVIIIIAVVKTSFKTLYSYHPWCEQEVGSHRMHFCFLLRFIIFSVFYYSIHIQYLFTVLFLSTFRNTTRYIAFLFTPMRCASFERKDVFCVNGPSADKTQIVAYKLYISWQILLLIMTVL